LLIWVNLSDKWQVIRAVAGYKLQVTGRKFAGCF